MSKSIKSANPIVRTVLFSGVVLAAVAMGGPAHAQDNGSGNGSGTTNGSGNGSGNGSDLGTTTGGTTGGATTAGTTAGDTTTSGSGTTTSGTLPNTGGTAETSLVLGAGAVGLALAGRRLMSARS